MWLWYLELYLVALVAFVAGGALGVLVVRLVVRRTLDDQDLAEESRQTSPGTTAGAST